MVRRSGVPASTLRFYEEKGLIASTGRRGLRRLFEPGVLERLALIALGQAAGFSLDEIALMFGPGRAAAHRPTDARGQGGGAGHRRSANSAPCATACGTPLLAPRRATWNVPLFAVSYGPPHLELQGREGKRLQFDSGRVGRRPKLPCRKPTSRLISSVHFPDSRPLGSRKPAVSPTNDGSRQSAGLPASAAGRSTMTN